MEELKRRTFSKPPLYVPPSTCIPDSCIVNIYEEGDCIHPHINNHDFVRPFCTISFLSECDIIFGSNLKIVGTGEFSGSFAIPLPVGSMDLSKRPKGCVQEPVLLDIEPLPYEVVLRDGPTASMQYRRERWQAVRRKPNGSPVGHSANKSAEPHNSTQERRGFSSQRGPERTDGDLVVGLFMVYLKVGMY